MSACSFFFPVYVIVKQTPVLVLYTKTLFKNFELEEVVEWSARLARKRAFRVRRLLAPLSMMHILL